MTADQDISRPQKHQITTQHKPHRIDQIKHQNYQLEQRKTLSWHKSPKSRGESRRTSTTPSFLHQNKQKYREKKGIPVPDRGWDLRTCEISDRRTKNSGEARTIQNLPLQAGNAVAEEARPYPSHTEKTRITRVQIIRGSILNRSISSRWRTS